MELPLHLNASKVPSRRPRNANAGLWFNKFCNKWRLNGSHWSMKATSSSKPKLNWVQTVCDHPVGIPNELHEYTSRITRLVKATGGCLSVFTTEWRLVTGIGLSHPVENGFNWHYSLGTPYIAGSSIKGAVLAFLKHNSSCDMKQSEMAEVFGHHAHSGSICFIDAIPVRPVELKEDIITNHYGEWDENNPPGDWMSPNPIPFLTVSAETPFIFSLVPMNAKANKQVDKVMNSLSQTLELSGLGAKTAVGYGRFHRDPELTKQIMSKDG